MTVCTGAASGTTAPVANLFRGRRSRFRARSDNRRNDSLTARRRQRSLLRDSLDRGSFSLHGVQRQYLQSDARPGVDCRV